MKMRRSAKVSAPAFPDADCKDRKRDASQRGAESVVCSCLAPFILSDESQTCWKDRWEGKKEARDLGSERACNQLSGHRDCTTEAKANGKVHSFFSRNFSRWRAGVTSVKYIAKD